MPRHDDADAKKTLEEFRQRAEGMTARGENQITAGGRGCGRPTVTAWEGR